MKTDHQIQKDVMEQLSSDPRIKAERVGVSVNEGIVTLSGIVSTYGAKILAEKKALRVVGVRSLVEQIRVELKGPHVRDDGEIAQEVCHALEWDVYVPRSVKASVEDGVVKLSGEVEQAFEREHAVSCIRNLAGVRNVMNFIIVRADS